MLKQHSSFYSLVILVFVLLLNGPHAYADDTNRFNVFIQGTQAHRAKIALQMGLDPQWHRLPEATCYYDDLEDHYAHDQMMSDFIDEGIR